jgi:hypothetical protein
MVRIEGRTTIGAPVELCFDHARTIELHMESPAGERCPGRRVTSGLIGFGQQVTWAAILAFASS